MHAKEEELVQGWFGSWLSAGHADRIKVMPSCSKRLIDETFWLKEATQTRTKAKKQCLVRTIEGHTKIGAYVSSSGLDR